QQLFGSAAAEGGQAQTRFRTQKSLLDFMVWIAIWSLATIVWAATRRDTEFEAFGRDALDQLRGGA
ncbi:MAG: hypothetical protein AAF488_08630, partial [Planctomycetota bacterium]